MTSLSQGSQLAKAQWGGRTIYRHHRRSSPSPCAPSCSVFSLRPPHASPVKLACRPAVSGNTHMVSTKRAVRPAVQPSIPARRRPAQPPLSATPTAQGPPARPAPQFPLCATRSAKGVQARRTSPHTSAPRAPWWAAGLTDRVWEARRPYRHHRRAEAPAGKARP